jgi:hypothetical protein
MSCDCGSRFNSGFHSTWCISLIEVVNTWITGSEREWFTQGCSEYEKRLFDLWAMGKLSAYHPDAQHPSPLYGAIMSAISAGYG